MASSQENKGAAGLSTRSFYSSTKKSPNHVLKRRLESACQSVKFKRVEDYLLSDTLDHSSFLHKDNPKVPLIYRVFAKQSEALEFAGRFISSSLKVFAFELDATGKRNFLACHPHTLWRLLKAKSANERHAYEVIGENMPSKVKKENKLFHDFLQLFLLSFTLTWSSKDQNFLKLTATPF